MNRLQATLASLAVSVTAQAQDTAVTLFTNVRVFDGTSAQLSAPSNVLVRGKLGVVAEGALADLLLVDGDPLTNLELVTDPAKNFVLIMKDGKVFKNTMK